MPASHTDLFAFLDAAGIAHQTVEHVPTFTVEEGRDLKASMPGGHTKNLFMKDKAGALVLLSAHCDAVIKLNRLHRVIGTKRLSFASSDLLLEHLGVVPGAVTAFALINDPGQSVRFLLDQSLLGYDLINFHPLRNDMTTAVSPDGFRAFLSALDRDLETIDVASLDADD